MTETSDLDKLIVSWCDGSMKVLAGAKPFVSIHVDEIMVKRKNSADLVSTSVYAYERLIIAAERVLDWIMPILVLPLKSTSHLELKPPEWAQIDDEIDPTEPPGLYLWKREVAMLPDVSEEYRFPLRLTIVKQAYGNVTSTYRVSRDVLAIENDWEFTRSVIFEHYNSAIPKPGE